MICVIKKYFSCACVYFSNRKRVPHFRKSARLRYGMPDRFCLLGSIPNPLENPFITYNTTQGVFDGVLREILQKDFPCFLIRGSFGNANVSEENG